MKKGSMFSVVLIIVSVTILLLLLLFSIIGFHQIGGEYIIDSFMDASDTMADSGQLPAASNTTSYAIKATYDEIKWPFDLYFLAFFILGFMTTIFSAYKTRKMGYMSFFGMLTIGSMVFLVVISFLDQFSTWFLQDFFYKVFDAPALATPIMNYYFAHLGIISIIWFVVLLLVNQIDIKFNMGEGRVQE